MPYRSGGRLPSERASKLGHLDVIESQLVRDLVRNFESPGFPQPPATAQWEPIPTSEPSLPYVFGVDGSFQIVESLSTSTKTLGFVKTALFRIDKPALEALDQRSPHPSALRDILKDSALFHATVFPLRHVGYSGLSFLEGVRRTIFESINDSKFDGAVMETLKWLAYEKWDGIGRDLPPFECPVCGSQSATLPRDAEVGPCPDCGEEIYLTDMLGFHLEIGDQSAPDGVARDYMTIHETLLLFTGIRYFWENRRAAMNNILFVKDGPLTIRAQYSKLVEPIRRFLSMARDTGAEICVLGQEKTGVFVDHLDLLQASAPEKSLFLPSDTYIRNHIQHRRVTKAPYGKDTNYGVKVFAKVSDRHRFVFNIPTGAFEPNPEVKDLIGVSRIFATVPSLLSSRYENGLLPIELANSVASLSTYPSTRILSLFAEKAVGP